MLAIISPAKTLDLKRSFPKTGLTQPRFLPEAEQLATAAARLSAKKLSELMSVSDKIATLNAGRFRDFQLPFTPDTARPAIYTFAGDVYTGFEIGSLDEAAIAYAQDHLRIISGLYGLLRPLDLMQAYRLEMGTRWAPGRKKTLYDWWGDKVGGAIGADLAQEGSGVILNLASQEYWQAAQRALPAGARVITVDFREHGPKGLYFNSFGAKKARGMMARHLCEHRIDDPDGLKGFDSDGYAFDAEGSEEDRWLFIRHR